MFCAQVLMHCWSVVSWVCSCFCFLLAQNPLSCTSSLLRLTCALARSLWEPGVVHSYLGSSRLECVYFMFCLHSAVYADSYSQDTILLLRELVMMKPPHVHVFTEQLAKLSERAH